MGEHILGRDDELAALTKFLAQPSSVPDVLALEGEPGIGKTTLWMAALREARDRGYLVLTAQPVQVESGLSFAGLRDLLDDAPPDALAKTDGPQRRALEIALLQRDPDPRPPDERAISFGLVGVLRGLADAGPVLLAVDDVHWLDRASARALGFALRRVGQSRIKVVCTRSTDVPSDVEVSQSAERMQHLVVGPLSLPTVRRLVRDELGGSFPLWVVQRIHEVSAGNPFFALELARAVAESGEPEIGSPLPLPADIANAARSRIGRLPETSRAVLGLLAVLSRPTIASVRRAFPDSRSTEAALRAAADADLVRLDNERVRFAHPILREAALAMLPVDVLRDLHRLAADVVSNTDERARHLALSATGRSEEMAAYLETAARESASRGSPQSAAELAELAAALSPEWGEEARRTLAAGDYRQLSGDAGRATELVTGLVDRLSPGPTRAEALHRLAVLTPDMGTGAELCRQALAEAGDDPRLRGVIHLRIGRLLGMSGDRSGWERSLKQAVELAEEAGDDQTVVAATQELATVGLLAGRGMNRALLERAQVRAAAIEGLPGAEQPRLWLAMQLVFADALDEARALMSQVLAETGGRGHLESDVVILVLLADLELRAGHLAAADDFASRGMLLCEGGDVGHESQSAAFFARAAVDAHLGRVESARAAATRGSQLAAAAQDVIWWAQNELILGFLAVSIDDAAGAWAHLGPLTARLREMRVRAPSVIPTLPCTVEALIGLGRLDEAEATIAEVERHGRRLGRRGIMAAVSRSRALVAGARGRGEVALEDASDAVERHRQLPYPFELGRSLLVQGLVQRRARQQRAARASLEEAASIFAGLNAPLWEAKARMELARVGGRRASSGELTETERRVAELVAEGRTNREVAVALYVSVRAVEANLSRIYDKLGIRSRAQLVRRLPDLEDGRV